MSYSLLGVMLKEINGYKPSKLKWERKGIISLHVTSDYYFITCSEKKPIVNKPKRWKTFRNAFKIPQRHQKASAGSSKVTKRKTIMERFRLKRSNVPTPLQIRKEQPLHYDRPLSDEIPKDTLVALEDVVPSCSLPATPLARKRSDPDNFSSEFSDPETVSTPNVVTVPVEINYVVVKEDKELYYGEPELQEASSDVKRFQERQFVWDQIRENLESDEVICAHSVSDQELANHLSGLEQLRAFLAICD